MSAQGGTIAGRSPMQLPIRPVVLLLAAVSAAIVGMTAIRLASEDERVQPAVTSVDGYWHASVAHPAIRDRNGVAATLPVQRLYPGGFVGSAEDAAATMPVQRLYPGGFVAAEADDPAVSVGGRHGKS